MQLWTPNQPLKNGRFIVQKILGGGGFGVTYSVVEQKINKLFAIKTLNPIHQSQGDFAEKQEQFLNEALRLKGCNHPYIVKVYELIQEDGLWGMVMEYIDGEDLGVYVDKHGQLSESEALRYIDQVGQALEYVHQQGFLHRDIKPNNIILRSGKLEAVLIDFGLVREFTIGKTLSMTNSKTEGYAPVEQYERQGRFGTYTDVYALAATLYNLLTARTPIPANYRKDSDIPLKAPKQFNSKMSDRVSDAIIKGMALEAQDRPQTVREWLELVMTEKVSPVVQLTPNPKSKIQNLKSSKMDYTRLRYLLAAGKWKEANEETRLVMLAVAGREKEGWLDYEHINHFPCEDLRILDQLWVKFSNGRFGFSAQKYIYEILGGTIGEYDDDYDIVLWKLKCCYGKDKIWEAFGDRIGWREKRDWLYIEEYTFKQTAPTAHLPIFLNKGTQKDEDEFLPSFLRHSVVSHDYWILLASRLVKCNI